MTDAVTPTQDAQAEDAQAEDAPTDVTHNDIAESAATQEDILPLSGLVLLGTYIRPKDSQALLRQRNGRMTKVSVGDRVARQEVVAITMGQVMLSRKGQTQPLDMPVG